jgi:hypothetical protein
LCNDKGASNTTLQQNAKKKFKALGPYLGPLSLQLLQELKYFKKVSKRKKIDQIVGEKN